MLEKPQKPEKENVKPRKRDSAESGATTDPAGREAALDRAALQFKALGDPTRLRIIRLLAGEPPMTGSEDNDKMSAAPGWTVGDVNFGLFGKSKATSTLSHHLKELRNAGLITMKRRGKNLMCRLHGEAIAALCCELASSEEFGGVKKLRVKERGNAGDSAAQGSEIDASTI